MQLGFATQESNIGVLTKRHFRCVRPRSKLALDQPQHLGDIDKLVRCFPARGLEPGQLDEVAKDTGHPLGLSFHLRDGSMPAFGQLRVFGQRVQVSPDHRKR